MTQTAATASGPWRREEAASPRPGIGGGLPRRASTCCSSSQNPPTLRRGLQGAVRIGRPPTHKDSARPRRSARRQSAANRRRLSCGDSRRHHQELDRCRRRRERQDLHRLDHARLREQARKRHAGRGVDRGRRSGRKPRSVATTAEAGPIGSSRNRESSSGAAAG